MKKKIYLIGVGVGSPSLMTDEARKLLLSCSEIYAPKRLAEIYKPFRCDIIEAGIDETFEKAEKSAKETLGILISGDCGFYSVAKRMTAEFGKSAAVEAVSGISSLAYLSAKSGLNYDDMFIMSLHGRQGSVLGPVSYNRKTFVLTGGGVKAHDICRDLDFHGLGEVKVIAGENLSMDSERVVERTASECLRENFSDLTSLIIINDNFADPYKIIKDEDFIRGDIPMTKEEIRRLCVAEMAVKPKDIIFDIGAGTGSVSVELARKAAQGLVYAVEKESAGIDLINSNLQKFGAYNLIPIEGEAPDAFENLPVPDKVFIGGSGKRLKEIADCIIEKNPKAKFVITAITLETLGQSVEIMKNMGIEPNIICINAAKSKPLGGYNMMIAGNPVYIISGERIEK